MSRFARENRDPAEYLSMSYYQIWFAALETMLKERASGRRTTRSSPGIRCIRRSRSSACCRPADVLKVLHRGGPTERDTNTKAAFKPGDHVRAKNINPLDPHAAAALRARAASARSSA